ncbi:MAG: MarR family transcriptional regulator [Methanospirillum sp.]
MRDEEIDWLCYTTLSRGPGAATVSELAAAAGLAEDEAAASAARLERALLAQREGDRVRLLAFQESLLLCQVRYGKDVPFEVEDGVIRARRADDA